MGMFDYVRCELPLPEGKDDLYQTKDTNRHGLMGHTITKAGRLVLHDYETEMTPKAERRYPNAPDDSPLSISGMIRRKARSERDVDQNFDGDLRFYGYASYRATFRAGNCIEICQEVEGSAWNSVWRKA